MKYLLFIFLLLPCKIFAQGDQTGGGYTITAKVSGYPDGTTVDLLNGNNGAPEATTKVDKGAFTFKGNSPFPDFKLIAFDKTAPYITLFLDNSNIKITAAKDALDQAVVTGSSSHSDFTAFNKLVKPYEKLFTPDAQADSASMKIAASVTENFARKNPKSFIAPLAIYRNNQMTGNAALMEELFSKTTPAVQASPIGTYIAQQIAEGKKNPLFKPLADFSQPDTSGQMVSLSSFRGKWVLVDFWASWCGPCRQENPNVVGVYHRFKDKNFTVLGISLDKTRKPWLDAIAADNLTWTHVSDLKFWQNAVAQQFQISSIPQNFLVDPQGIVVAKNLRGPALESKLASVLK